jgi:hypothetical protein
VGGHCGGVWELGLGFCMASLVFGDGSRIGTAFAALLGCFVERIPLAGRGQTFGGWMNMEYR